MKNYFVIAVLKGSNDIPLEHRSNGPVYDLYIPSVIINGENHFKTKEDAEFMVKGDLTVNGNTERYTIIEVWGSD